jgi:hypothetical protein
VNTCHISTEEQMTDVLQTIRWMSLWKQKVLKMGWLIDPTSWQDSECPLCTRRGCTRYDIGSTMPMKCAHKHTTKQ